MTKNALALRNGDVSLLPSRDQFFRPFEDTFNRFFDDFFGDRQLGSMVKGQGRYPKLDVMYKDNKWLVELACPGATPDDVEVRVVPDKSGAKYVKISGRMSDEYAHEDATYYVKELSRSSWERLVRLPENVVRDEPDALLKDGVLRLTWETTVKKDPEAKVVKIRTE
jgi:HSP20 family molecular chaperone IbpA